MGGPFHARILPDRVHVQRRYALVISVAARVSRAWYTASSTNDPSHRGHAAELPRFFQPHVNPSVRTAFPGAASLGRRSLCVRGTTASLNKDLAVRVVLAAWRRARDPVFATSPGGPARYEKRRRDD